MNTITLHRKGGRVPWVFRQNSILNARVFEHTTKFGTLYRIVVWNKHHETQRFYGEELNGKPWWRDVKPYKIHASHFKLGNVTVTF